ncbi:Sensor histidine kinase TmoS [Massilia sp. Bi118]|uniref:response regulator n=1 Tax=Massilia sp. Bi118 TaxID=2822346 RepID=UPI001E15A285|nr:response regulator [Massilia sp. Bi118]CAH0198839.1 Sensor histidine kinase TmoS [Massilia sp. Bi118]
MANDHTSILLVDDQPANLAVLQATLAGLADELVSVTSGEAALREVLARDFAVVLLDVRMPTMNGFELAELIRQHPRTQALPIIFLTAGDADEFPIEHAYSLGAVDYMTKPFNTTVLRAKTGVFIELHRKRAELARIEEERHRQAASDRMRDIFDRAPALMCVMSGPAHVVDMANRRFIELAGGRLLAGLPLRAAMPELEGQDFVELIERVYRGGEAVDASNARLLLRAPAPRAGLDEHFLDFVCMPLREPDGSVSGVLLHGVDVTERTRANALAVGQRGALELAVTDAPLGDVLDVLARTAEDVSGGAALASVQLVSGDGHYLRHAAAPSLPLEFQLAIDAVRLGPLAGSAATAAWRAEAVASPDIAADSLWSGQRELALAHGLHGCRALPILAPSGAVLGAFSLYYRDAGHLAPQEEAALALLANTASLVIGQRHEAAERQAAEHRSRAILESMSEGFIALDAEWRITYANGAAEDLTRKRREDLVGGQFWDLFPALRGSTHEPLLRRSALQRSRSRMEVYDEAQARWFEINSFPMESSGTDASRGTGDGGLALYFRDETDRRRAEEGVRRLAAVAEQSSDFIGIFTPDAGGIYLNPAGRRMAGLSDDTNIAAWRMLDFFPREDRAFVRDHMMAALTGEQAEWEGELRLAQPQGREPVPVYFKGFAVRDANGQNIGLATITRDITAQKNAEDELRRVAADLSEADHRKSEFLATLAHELRNPLAPIRTGLDLLRMAPGDVQAADRVHGMMDRQLGHLIHLVDDLLDIARITRGKIELKKEPVLLRAIVATAVETSTALIESHHHQLSVELPPEPLELEADVTRMVQVLSNLLNNAAKYTPAGGRIALSAWREDGHAVVSVADSGVGIPQDSIGSVFEMFTQVRGSLDRAQGGLGIGLSLVRRLVELHGGRVGAFSGGPGQGSTFTLRLPLRPGSPHALAAPGQEGEVQETGAGGPLRVLVVDDNADAADSLAALLDALGHTTVVAHDGVDGLAAAREFVPDLVFLDIGLPGMSGHEVAREIRRTAALRQVVLIALTGWGSQSDQRQSQEAGFDQHLTKPVSLEALEQALTAAARSLP